MQISVIDPGHGGHTVAGRSTPHGARGPGGMLEKDVTLRLAESVAHHLGDGARLTRDGDANLSLAGRVAIARDCGARVFVSLHVNDREGRGAEAFTHPRATAASRGLARALQGALSRYGGGPGGVHAAELAVLSPEHHAPDTAACLVELDCLARPDSERRLRDDSELDRIGRAIAGAVQRFLRGHPVEAALARGLTSESPPSASAPELLDFEATGVSLEELRQDMAAYRQHFIDALDAFHGFGVDDRPPGRRAAYGDIIALHEKPAMREALLVKDDRNSSCGLVIRTAWRLLGVRDPLIHGDYKPGTVLTGLLEYARKCGALNPAGTVDAAQPGDVIYIYKAPRQHIFTITGRDGDVFTSVDGGQSAPPGSDLDDGGCNGVRRRVRRRDGDRFVGDDRTIFNWIDVGKLQFQAPVFRPLRNPSKHPQLPDPPA